MERAFGGHLLLAESWECPQQALIGRLVLMKFLKCIYLHLHNSPTLPHCKEQLSALLARLCVHSHLWKIPCGRFPVGKGCFGSKRAVSGLAVRALCLRSDSAAQVPAVTQLPGFNQQLNKMFEANASCHAESWEEAGLDC